MSWSLPTRSSRPGTPGHAATPATAVDRPIPVSTSATMAASAFATLNGPGRVMDASASTPPGPTTWKVDPSAPHRTSAARQSDSDRPPAEYVVMGMAARLASRRPYGSSTLITADLAYLDVNRRAFAAK